MAIKGTLSRVATIGGRVAGTSGIVAKQVSVGSNTNVDITSKTLSELADVSATEVDQGVLKYNAETDSWEASNQLDGGTY